ncbi:uncharacterized protein LAESUDRAFT_734124 [Laetiporus sulphureus 93-53]|uniref:Centrosomin N-terminal motif 1 domain-containing protein n=1 Tax=Laetiporus sulphureus 93-53 TaxID=1314785 RepID=A0A165H3H8_9APHY|nr:uncharacterized protein LAESUDRAFT_734124 [Laetiporus sulphureus 93-53]KZT11194.1 hypothetical protein LAESUDRAFT_734124 [Laetiporus sulphureus 93-53]
MSAALNSKADSSPGIADLSLNSLASGFSTPGWGLRKFSGSSQTTSSAPIATPSPPMPIPMGSRRRTDEVIPAARRFGLQNLEEEGEEGNPAYLETPAQEKRWDEVIDTPAPGQTKRTRSAGGKGTNLTLRDQEKHIDSLKKENFNIKLKVHFLEERLAQLAPDQIDAALKQNINLKIEVQQRGMEMKKLKKLVLELERELERLQRGSGSAQARARELEEKLEEREREIRELRRRRAVGPDDGTLRDLEEHNAHLQGELDAARGLLDVCTEELDQLKEAEERRRRGVTNEGQWEQRAAELEEDNENLRLKIDDLEEQVTRRNDEKEDLADMVEALKLENEELRRRREAESIERSESRAQIIEEQEERAAVEDDLNAVRDKLAAAHIELQQKEDDIDMKNREIEELVSEHTRIVETIDDEWRGEMEESRGQVEELKDALQEREQETKDLRIHITDLETELNELHGKFEAALEHIQRESDEKDVEIEAANREIEKLGGQVYALEEENEHLKEQSERTREDEAAERERLEALAAALKEVRQSSVCIRHTQDRPLAQLEEMTENYDARSQEVEEYRSRSEELAQHVENLVEEIQLERSGRERLNTDLRNAEQEHDTALRKEHRAVEAKESALQSALNDLARTQSLLAQRETDLSAVQTALETFEAESKKLGESHTTARFSLQLEVDRLKRDLERLEDELSRARKELEDREGRGHERDAVIDKLHVENRDLASQLASQTQARLNVSEKLDETLANLKTAEAELSTFRSRVAELEQRLAKDQRSLLTAESQYRDQLTERNTLLLTIYQYMDKILGVDKTPKKHGQAETKPFTNFSVFHDNLISRLKSLSDIQLIFEKRVKEAEGRYTEKIGDMRKQLDYRWKQIDRFEASVKTVAEQKATWRKKLSTKEGEVEALKSTNSDLQSQLVSMKKPGQGDSSEVRALTARAMNAERRITNLQNQLLSAEEKLTTMNEKTSVADNKWEVRVREYEARLKKAEEAVKRERQGAKERVYELELQMKSLQRQLDLENRRNQKLNEITEAHGLINNKPTSSPGR